MKRLFLFILAVNLMLPAFAHKYLQQGLSWQNLYENGRYLVPETLTVDTIVNGKEYLAFSRYFLMRDDSTGLYFHTNVCDSDFLLFQYGANVGDSIMIYNSQYPTGMWAPQGCPGEDDWEGLYAVVTAVDTIHLLNGEPRRRIFYQSSMFMGGNWYIEGIGGFHGIKGDNFDTESYIPEMLCCYIGDTLLWARNDCEQWQSKYSNACLGYTPLKTADTWHAIDYIMVAGKVYSVTDAVYNLTSDTIINEQTYRKLVRNNSTCVGALRQTEDGMKVYFFDLQSGYSHTPQEYLLYDFSASVGDTIDAYFSLDDMPSFIDHMGEPESIGWLVIEKDTIDGRINMVVDRCYDDSISSEISESSLLHYRTRWIQGVGTSHVLWSAYYGVVGMSELFTLCAMHGDETLYTYNLESLGIENNCSEWHFTGLNDIPADNAPRKFLRDGQLLIETPLGIFDATGKLVE